MQQLGISIALRRVNAKKSFKSSLLCLGFLVQGMWIVCSLIAVSPVLAQESQLNQRREGSEQQAVTNYQNADILLTQAPAILQITSVTLNSTEAGIEVLLATPNSKILQPVTFAVGKTYIANIPNAVLALPQRQEFLQVNPVDGIASVSVTQATPNSVRVAVTGAAVSPQVELYDSPNEGLVLSLTPATSPQPEKPAAQTDEAMEIVVTGEQDSYRVPNATTGTKTDTPLRDVPQSIQVVPRQIIEDQKATNIGEALRNVSGVSLGATGSLTSFPDQFKIRGFDASNFNGSVYINGIRRRGRSFADSANIAQLEVVKGPASVLYGQAEPGGVINIVTEQPLAKPYYAGEFTIGNYDFYRPALDISSPLNTEKTVRYRLNAAYQNSGSFVDFVDLERFAITPVISFDFGENTTLVLEGDYQSNSTPDYDGLPAVGTVLPNPFGRIPKSRFIDDPESRNQIYANTTIGYRLQHKFSDRWLVRNSFNFESLDVNEDIISPTLQPNNRTINRSVQRGETNSQYYSLQTDFIGNLKTGNVEHQLLLGLDLFRGVTDLTRLSATLPSIDLFDPVYERSPVLFSPTRRALDLFEQQNILGVYAQDLISLGNKVKLLLGGRFDWIDQDYDNKITNREFEQEDNAFSPRVGVVYQPIEPVSLYANYSRSFVPSAASTVNANGTPFEPTKGEQFEVGVKTEFLDGRLAATLAAYEITKQNIVVPDPDNSALSLQVGEQRSRGIELDVVGEILPGFNLIATYAYTDAEITEDTRPAFEGNQPNNVPRHSGSLWATYEIQRGNLQGLGFGAGIFVIGDRQGDLANTFELPSYVRTDAAIFYRRDNWQVGLNFKNLFDVDYYESARDRNAVFYGAPFTVLGTVSVNF